MGDAHCHSPENDNSVNSSGHGLFGKYASYFSTMNPLAARIYEDIQKVEVKCENFDSLSYDEKCSVVDKHLLFSNASVTEDGQIVSHTATMLTSVCPNQKTEICEDDDHGVSSALSGKHSKGRFTTCTESEIKACHLGKLLQRVTLLSKKKKRSSMSKKSKKAPAPKPTLSRSSTESYGMDETPTNHPMPMADRRSWYRGDEELRNYEIESSGKKHELIERKPKLLNKAEITYDDNEDEDDRLPQQKQNLDLIAELQAKLKRNKGVGGSSDGRGSGNSPILKHHVLKPKAPPPPPPQKMDVEKKPVAEKETNSNKKNSSDHEEFLVDVSSPCRIATPKTGFDFLDNW